MISITFYKCGNLQPVHTEKCTHRLAGADMERAYQGPCECQGGVLNCFLFSNLVLAQYHW